MAIQCRLIFQNPTCDLRDVVDFVELCDGADVIDFDELGSVHKPAFANMCCQAP